MMNGERGCWVRPTCILLGVRDRNRGHYPLQEIVKKRSDRISSLHALKENQSER